MPKPYEEFKVSDWDWLSKHFELSKAERIAKVAWSIARSTPETIPQHSLTLDPFIVIPLCAIALRDDINISILRGNKRLRSAADRAKNTTELKQQAQFIEKVLSVIEPSPRWRYLFDSLTPELQFDLLDRLINYRRPTIGDWRNLFREVKYEFKNSWHYRLVLFLALAMSIVAIVEIVQIIVRQPDLWLNGLLGLGIFVVIVFWIFLWQGIKEKLESTTFTSFGLFGVFTFWRELRRLFRQKIVWAGVKPLLNSFTYTGARAMSWFITVAVAVSLTLVEVRAVTVPWVVAKAVAGAWVGTCVGARFVIVTRSIAVAGAWAGVEAWNEAKTGAWFRAIALALAGTGVGAGAFAWFWAVARVFSIAGAGVGAGVGAEAWAKARALVGDGAEAWAKAKDKQDFGKFLAVFAFPFFCWSPIVIYFSTLALLQFLPWQQTLFAWLTLIGVGTGLWLWGQKLEEQARNPLKGILARTERLN